MSAGDTKLVLATSNQGKLLEFRALLAGLPLTIVTADEVLGRKYSNAELGRTFEDNAFSKAADVYFETDGMLVLADDSGLEVDALDGAPGVRSARFAGERSTQDEKINALLRALEGVPWERRKARFRCVLCVAGVVEINGEEVRWESEFGHGACEGMIAFSPRGVNGFGYDPLFVVEGGELTMAELSAEQKGAVSHRARAVADLRPKLERFLALERSLREQMIRVRRDEV